MSRTTYERLKAFCETNNVSMSQFVETRVGDFLADAPVVAAPAPVAVAPKAAPAPRPVAVASAPVQAPARPVAAQLHTPARPTPVASQPMSSPPSLAAAARAALEPRVVIAPVSKERTENPKPPTPRTADQIFTF